METPADIVNEFYETCNRKQGQGMEAFVADDIEFEGPALNISGGKKYIEVVKPLCAFSQENAQVQTAHRGRCCSVDIRNDARNAGWGNTGHFFRRLDSSWVS